MSQSNTTTSTQSAASTSDSAPDLAPLLTTAFSLLALQITGMDEIFQMARLLAIQCGMGILPMGGVGAPLGSGPAGGTPATHSAWDGCAAKDSRAIEDFERHAATAMRAQGLCTRAAATLGRLAQLKLLGGDGVRPKKEKPKKPVHVETSFLKEDPATPGICKPVVIKTPPDSALAWLIKLCSNSESAASTYNSWITDGDHWKAGPIYPVVGFKMKAAALRELADQTEAEEKIATEALLKDMDERPWRPLAQAREKKRIEAENKAAAEARGR